MLRRDNFALNRVIVLDKNQNINISVGFRNFLKVSEFLMLNLFTGIHIVATFTQ